MNKNKFKRRFTRKTSNKIIQMTLPNVKFAAPLPTTGKMIIRPLIL